MSIRGKELTGSKGILLVGGSGSRLAPATVATNKHLLPIYDKPMVYYPLTTLMLAGIREILVILRDRDATAFETLLGDGSQWGVSIRYAIQDEPNGIAEALVIGESFIAEDPVLLILGDNVFYGSGLGSLVRRLVSRKKGASILGYHVPNPSQFAVVELDGGGTPISIEEKPSTPKSNLAVPGLYFYDSRAAGIAKQLARSARQELEITDVNRSYLARGDLSATVVPRGIAWLDAGTHDGLHKASSFVQAVQERQGLLVASPEEVALRLGLISIATLSETLSNMGENSYRAFLERLCEQAFIREPNRGS